MYSQNLLLLHYTISAAIVVGRHDGSRCVIVLFRILTRTRNNLTEPHRRSGRSTTVLPPWHLANIQVEAPSHLSLICGLLVQCVSTLAMMVFRSLRITISEILGIFTSFARDSKWGCRL